VVDGFVVEDAGHGVDRLLELLVDELVHEGGHRGLREKQKLNAMCAMFKRNVREVDLGNV
jgi:hypothetical protein